MRVPVFGSRTLRMSRTRPDTLPPTTPDLTTKDLGTLAAFGSLTSAAETWVLVFLRRPPLIGILGEKWLERKLVLFWQSPGNWQSWRDGHWAARGVYLRAAAAASGRGAQHRERPRRWLARRRRYVPPPASLSDLFSRYPRLESVRVPRQGLADRVADSKCSRCASRPPVTHPARPPAAPASVLAPARPRARYRRPYPPSPRIRRLLSRFQPYPTRDTSQRGESPDW